MAFDDNDRRIISEAVREGVREGIGSVPRSRYAPDSAGGTGGGGARPSAGGLGDAVFKGLESGAGLVGQAFSGANRVIGENVENFQQLSRTGASFNNNAMGMRDSIGQTRLSMDEYKQVMDKLSPSIAGLGGTVDQGTKNFNRFSGEFMNTNFAEQLTKMGYTTKDLNDVMAANMANRRFTDLSDDMQRKKAIEATAELARQMDETSKLTGISRQEQIADMKARSENGKVQAAIQLEMIRGGKDVEQNYNNMQQSLNGLGKGVKDLADEMFTGGVRTEEGAAKMAALGPAGIELQKAVEASKKAKTQEEKDAAEAQLNRAKMAVNERMKSEEFLQAVMVAGGKVGPAMQKMYEENKLRAGTTATEAKTGQTTGQAMATNQAAAVNQQQGRDEKGAKDEGAKTTELYIQVVNRAKDVQSLWNTELNKLNDTLVKSADGTRLLNRALDATRNQREPNVPFIQEGYPGLKERVKLAGGIGQESPATTPRPPTPGNERSNQPNTGPFNNSPNPVGTALDNLGRMFTDERPGVVRAPNSAPAATPPANAPTPFADGTKDTLGDWFGKNFGTAGSPALLHGKEAVVPEGKVGEFMQDMMKKANISNISTKAPETNKVSMTAEEMDGMVKSMKSINPESLLQMVKQGSGQQSELANKVYSEMIVAQKQAKEEQRIEKPTVSKATPATNPIAELQQKLVDAGAKLKVDGKIGPETMTAIKANMASMVRDTAKKTEAAAPAPAPAEAPKATAKTATPGSEATLSDVVKSLESLNMLMGQLTAHAAETAEHSGAAVKATKGLSGNLFAR